MRLSLHHIDGGPISNSLDMEKSQNCIGDGDLATPTTPDSTVSMTCELVPPDVPSLSSHSHPPMSYVSFLQKAIPSCCQVCTIMVHSAEKNGTDSNLFNESQLGTWSVCHSSRIQRRWIGWRIHRNYDLSHPFNSLHAYAGRHSDE